MSIKKLLAIALIAWLLYMPVLSYATDLRGLVVGQNQFRPTPYPIPGAIVDLYMQGPYGWVLVSRYITGGDGMYYFINISPGPYVLQINGRQNYPLGVLNQPYQDIGPIIIQY